MIFKRVVENLSLEYYALLPQYRTHHLIHSFSKRLVFAIIVVVVFAHIINDLQISNAILRVCWEHCSRRFELSISIRCKTVAIQLSDNVLFYFPRKKYCIHSNLNIDFDRNRRKKKSKMVSYIIIESSHKIFNICTPLCEFPIEHSFIYSFLSIRYVYVDSFLLE